MLLTRPQIRDRVRRLLQIVPPIDTGSGLPGAQPSAYPLPSNEQINNCIEYAISDINNQAHTHVTQINVEILASDAPDVGPFGLYLGNLTPNSAGYTTAVEPIGLIRDIQRVLWNPGSDGTTLIRLTAKDRQALDRAQDQYFITAPGTPGYYYIEDYTLYLYPAQSEDGTLILTCGTGFTGLVSETDVLDQFPLDFQSILLYQIIVNLSRFQTMDAEAMERMKAYIPVAERGMALISAYRNNADQTQPTFGFTTYRKGYGGIRVRR